MEKSKKKTSTLKDVAKEAGVSVGTVSNYLKDPSKVKKVNREKIKNAVEDLQFIPDINAQILATGKSKVVILYVVSESAISPSTWLHQLPIMQVLHDELQKENYVLHAAFSVHSVQALGRLQVFDLRILRLKKKRIIRSIMKTLLLYRNCLLPNCQIWSFI